MTPNQFLFGLAVINCAPGPNFNFAAYCGGLALQQILNVPRDGRAIAISLLGSLIGYVVCLTVIQLYF
jgi:hypothetical protein